MAKKTIPTQQPEFEYIGQATILTSFIKKNGALGVLCLWVVGLQVQMYFTRQDLRDCYMSRPLQTITAAPAGDNKPDYDSPAMVAIMPDRFKIISDKH